jgi:hypothetical protein
MSVVQNLWPPTLDWGVAEYCVACVSIVLNGTVYAKH